MKYSDGELKFLNETDDILNKIMTDKKFTRPENFNARMQIKQNIEMKAIDNHKKYIEQIKYGNMV